MVDEDGFNQTCIRVYETKEDNVSKTTTETKTLTFLFLYWYEKFIYVLK